MRELRALLDISQILMLLRKALHRGIILKSYFQEALETEPTPCKHKVVVLGHGLHNLFSLKR